MYFRAIRTRNIERSAERHNRAWVERRRRTRRKGGAGARFRDVVLHRRPRTRRSGRDASDRIALVVILAVVAVFFGPLVAALF